MNRLLEKIATSENAKAEAKKELMQTGTIGAMGFGTGAVATKLGKRFPTHLGNHAGKMGALIGGLGLIGDYAAVKLNKHIEKTANDFSNKYLEKITAKYSN